MAVTPAPLRANDEPAFLTLRAGYAGDFIEERNSGGLFAFEYRPGPSVELFNVRPSLGGQITTDGAVYGWIGLNLDLFFGRRFVLTPTTGIGAYSEGDGQDLGGVLVFRNGIDFAYRFDNRARLGIGFHYKSNYGINDEDPGIGALTLFYKSPLGDLLP